jgi:hypothetical protein
VSPDAGLAITGPAAGGEVTTAPAIEAQGPLEAGF